MSEETRAAFAELAALPDEDIELDRAALLIARETDETVDVEFYLGFLDKLAVPVHEQTHRAPLAAEQ